MMRFCFAGFAALMAALSSLGAGATEPLKIAPAVAQSAINLCYLRQSGVPFKTALASNVSSLLTMHRSFGFLGIPGRYDEAKRSAQIKFFTVELSLQAANRCRSLIPPQTLLEIESIRSQLQ